MSVYFIKPIGMRGPVKIGCSRAPDTRRYTLETWSPFPLEIVAEIAGNRDTEARFHSRFADSWERREWFTWTPELQAVIDAINAGTFDVASLPAKSPINRCRPTRDLSYMTVAWRYKNSVNARMRHIAPHPGRYNTLKEFFGECPYRTAPEEYFAHKAGLEALIEALRLQPALAA